MTPPSERGADPIPAIGYIRVSTYLEEKISPELQHDAIESWAVRAGRRIVRWVEDLDATGRNFRRKIMLAIEEVEHATAQEIAVWRFSRFGRTRHGVAVNLARLHAVGGELQSATEEVDASTAAGRFARGMLLEVAAFESDKIGEQWQETHAWRRAHGLPATGGRRFGFIWTPRRVPDPERPGEWLLQDECYAPDPETGPVLAERYQRHIAGEGFYLLTGHLNQAGYRTPRGNPWSMSSLINYMDSGFAAGLLRVHRRDVPCGDRRRCQKYRDHYQYLPADHPGVIDDDTWHAYLAHRSRIQALPVRARTATYPLTGLVGCGLCRESAVTNGKPGKPGYSYRCSGQATRRSECPGLWIRRAVVEQAVYEWLLRLAGELDARTVGQEVQPAATKALDHSAQIKRLMAEASKHATAIDNATKAYVRGVILEESYLRVRDELTADLKSAQAKIEELKEEQQAERGPGPYREVVEVLASDWLVLPVQAKRDALARLIRRVWLWSGDKVQVQAVWQPDP